MSEALLAHLQGEHAFDPAPVRHDLAVYHVPFSELVPGSRPEEVLLRACRGGERVALVGESGSGKSSLTAHALGPLADDLAPLVVPVAREGFEVVTDPKAMFAHVTTVIAAQAAQAEMIGDEERAALLEGLTSQRPVGRPTGTGARFAVGWMGASLAAELSRQVPPAGSIDRSATETMEVLFQMVELVRSTGLLPVLVFDDTDRWLRGPAYPEPGALVGAFFGRVVRELAELRCAVVVAVHRHYLEEPPSRAAVQRSLGTLVEVPRLPTATALTRVLESRVRAHTPTGVLPAGIDDVFAPGTADRLFEHYAGDVLQADLRGVMRTVHTALAQACDALAGLITPELVDDAVALWEG